MDCPDARPLLVFRRPGGPPELAPDDLAALDQHLAGCPACAAAAARQDGFDAAVAAAMTAVPVPPGLRDALAAAAVAQQARRWRRQAAQVAAAAAGLMVTAGLLTGVAARTRPPLDGMAIADQFSLEAADREAAVRRWLAGKGLPPTLPLDFDYQRFHRRHGTDTVLGRDAEFVLFEMIHPDRIDVVKVLIVRTGRFDTRAFKDAQNSECSVRELVHPDAPRGVRYVVLYTSATLDLFLKPAARPG